MCIAKRKESSILSPVAYNILHPVQLSLFLSLTLKLSGKSGIRCAFEREAEAPRIPTLRPVT